MARKLFLGLLAVTMILALCSIPAFAEDQPLKFKGGLAERIRHEYWKNNRDMNTQQYDAGDRNYFRIKTSFWGQADYDDDLSLYIKLTNENKAYTFYGANANGGKDYHYDPDEWVFDNLYLDAKKVMGSPVDLRVGRQDFIGATGYGEGFLIADGTPNDGSRTFYFNAAKASWTMDEQKTLDFIYINDPRDDEMLPVFNGKTVPTSLTVTDEQAFVLYMKNKVNADLNVETYYIHKKEDNVGGSGLQAQRGYINTLGLFAKKALAPWTFRGQFADQFGKYGSEDRTGFGGYAFVDRDFKETIWSPSATAGVVYLSGDDKKTSKNEGWNPLFSRTPWMSELYCSEFTGESGVAYWTNLQMYKTGVSAKPTEKIKVSLFYNFLRANQTIPANATYSYSGEGKNRGHLEQAKIEYTVNKNVSTYFLAEYFQPSSVYNNNADDAVFLRTEVMIKF